MELTLEAHAVLNVSCAAEVEWALTVESGDNPNEVDMEDHKGATLFEAIRAMQKAGDGHG